VLEAGVLASSAEVLVSDDGRRVAGDPVDGARGPRNASLAWSVLVSILVVALALYVPALAEALGTTALDAPELGILIALALLPAALFEAVKALRRPRTPWRAAPRKPER
jgi:hypothetical protein